VLGDKKVIVFCHCCNRIVGNSFPIYNHDHGFGNRRVSVKLVSSGNLGFGCYEDTPENRKFLAEHYPPRDEITIKL